MVERCVISLHSSTKYFYIPALCEVDCGKSLQSLLVFYTPGIQLRGAGYTLSTWKSTLHCSYEELSFNFQFLKNSENNVKN